MIVNNRGYKQELLFEFQYVIKNNKMYVQGKVYDFGKDKLIETYTRKVNKNGKTVATEIIKQTLQKYPHAEVYNIVFKAENMG